MPFHLGVSGSIQDDSLSKVCGLPTYSRETKEAPESSEEAHQLALGKKSSSMPTVSAGSRVAVTRMAQRPPTRR